MSLWGRWRTPKFFFQRFRGPPRAERTLTNTIARLGAVAFIDRSTGAVQQESGPPCAGGSMNKASLIGVRAALASYAAFALVACGGGGGYVAPAPPPPSVPLPAATYTVGGMVSGLEGSGVVLANG